jgi:hypothetical protein
MIVEQRTYTLQPGTIQEFLRLYEAEGYDIQRSALGDPVGYYSTEVGPINQIIHMWAYVDFADRTERRKRLQALPEWRAWTPKARPFYAAQENRILVPANFMRIEKTESGNFRIG